MKIPNVTIQQLLEAGVHLGHKTLRWNPKMKKTVYISLNPQEILTEKQLIF